MKETLQVKGKRHSLCDIGKIVSSKPADNSSERKPGVACCHVGADITANIVIETSVIQMIPLV